MHLTQPVHNMTCSDTCLASLVCLCSAPASVSSGAPRQLQQKCVEINEFAIPYLGLPGSGLEGRNSSHYHHCSRWLLGCPRFHPAHSEAARPGFALLAGGVAVKPAGCVLKIDMPERFRP